MTLTDSLAIAGFVLGLLNTVAIVYGLRYGLTVIPKEGTAEFSPVRITQPPLVGLREQPSTYHTAVQFRLDIANRKMRSNSVTDIGFSALGHQASLIREDDVRLEKGLLHVDVTDILGLEDRNVESPVLFDINKPAWWKMLIANIAPGEYLSGWVSGLLPVDLCEHGSLSLSVRVEDGHGRVYRKEVVARRSSIGKNETPVDAIEDWSVSPSSR